MVTIARAHDPRRLERVFFGAHEDDRGALLERAPGVVLIGLDDERRDARRREILDERLDGGAGAIDDDVVAEPWLGLARQTFLEPFLQEWHEVDRDDEEHEEDTDELQEHDEESHRRMAPPRIGPVAAKPRRGARPP